MKLSNVSIYQSIVYGDNSSTTYKGVAVKFDPVLRSYDSIRIEGSIPSAGNAYTCVEPGSSDGTNLSAGVVHHAVAIYDRTNAGVYLNGHQVISVPMTQAGTCGGANGLVIGNSQGRNSPTYGGLQKVALYTTALTPSAVQNHYTARISAPTPSPSHSLSPSPVRTSTPAATPTPIGKPRAGVPLMSASQIANAVGINTHVTETSVAGYSNASKTLSLLSQVGVRHIRDGMQFGSSYAIRWFNTMASSGIRVDYIIPNLPSHSAITSWLNAVPSSVEAVEGVNEANGFVGGSNWPSQDAQSQATLYRSAQSWNKGVPVLSPTITSERAARSLAAAGPAIASNVTACAMHNYSGWRNVESSGWGSSDLNAGYGSIPFNENQGALLCGHTVPFYSTEAGWNNTVPEAIRARYIPRLYAYQTLVGISRTYMYELADDDGYQWGVFDSSGNIKPSGLALSNYTKIYNDPGPASLTPLKYSISGATCNQHGTFPSSNNGLKCLLAQRQDGSYLLGLWLSNESYNRYLHTYETVNPIAVTVHLATTKPVSTSTFNDDGSVTTTNLGAVSTIHYSASDHYGVLHIGP